MPFFALVWFRCSMLHHQSHNTTSSHLPLFCPPPDPPAATAAFPVNPKAMTTSRNPQLEPNSPVETLTFLPLFPPWPFPHIGHRSIHCHALAETHLQSQLLYLKLLRGTAVPIHIFMVVDHHHVILLHDGLVVLGVEVMDAVFAVILGDLQALLPPGQSPQR